MRLSRPFRVEGTTDVPPPRSSTERLAPLLTTREVAQLLRLSEKSIRRLVAHGRIPCVRFGRVIRFATGDVLAWLSARKEG